MALDFITAGIELFSKGLEKFIPDANLRLQAAEELAQQANGIVMGQIALNTQEAQSSSMLVSGWRPMTGWVCLGGLSYEVILRPVVQSLLNFWYPLYSMLSLDISVLMTILFGMLGLGAYRTFEKVQGVTK